MDSEDDVAGRGNACCLMFFNLITMILCLCLWISVSWLMEADFCQVTWYCCSLSCWYKCLGTQCYGGEWFTTRPIGQDYLPAPQNFNLSNEGDFTTAGDGEYDYWSTGVTAIIAPISCILVMIAACGTGAGRSGPAGCLGITILLGCMMKIACCVCLGTQFFSRYEGRTVFNYFARDPYQKIDTTLIYYLNNDKYMWGWGNLISASFSFLIITIIYDFFFGMFVLCANNAKYTGVKEWEVPQVSYTRTRTRGRTGQYTANNKDVPMTTYP